MNQNFTPLVLVFAFFAFVVTYFITNPIYNDPKFYAVCGTTHVTFEDGHINIFRETIQGEPNPFKKGWTYKVSDRRAKENRVSYYEEDRRCVADWYNELYPNKLRVFEWDIEKGTALYDERLNCKILPPEEMPKGFKFPNKENPSNIDKDC